MFADRTEISSSRRGRARSEFYAKAQPCLRSSDLGKRYGWGIHADAEGRLALYGVDSAEYAEFTSGQWRAHGGGLVTIVRAMRSSRARA